MRSPFFTLIAVLAVGLLSPPAFLQEKGGDDRTGPFDVVRGWPQPLALAKPGYIWGSDSGIFAESPNRIFVSNRGELKLPDKLPPNFSGAWGSLGEPATTPKPEFRNCIVIVDASGKVVESWTQWDHLFEGGRGPHSVAISPYDPDHHVWVVDDVHHQVFTFTNDGKKLLMTLGERLVPGNDETHFNRPTDVAWLPDGTFFVSDGYENTRVVKFDKNGKFLMAWGQKGQAGKETRPGYFNLVHSVAIDNNRRVYVSDRDNDRVQIFDEHGKYLDEWRNITQPSTIRISADGYAWVFTGSQLERMLKYDTNGHFLYGWGTHGTTPGFIWGVHGFSADSDGNLYVAEVLGGRTQKFKPRPTADPTHFYKQRPLMPMRGTR